MIIHNYVDHNYENGNNASYTEQIRHLFNMLTLNNWLNLAKLFDRRVYDATIIIRDVIRRLFTSTY